MFFGVMSSVVAYRVAHVDVGYDTQQPADAPARPPGRAISDAALARGAFYRVRRDAYAAATRPSTASLLRAPTRRARRPDGRFEPRHGRPRFRRRRPRVYVQGVLGPVRTIGITLRAGRAFDRATMSAQRAGRHRQRVTRRQALAVASPIGRTIRLAVRRTRRVPRDRRRRRERHPDRHPFARSQPAGDLRPAAADRRARREGLLPPSRRRGRGQAAPYHACRALDRRAVVRRRLDEFEEMLTKSALIATLGDEALCALFRVRAVARRERDVRLDGAPIGQRTREIGIRRALGALMAASFVLLSGREAVSSASGVVATPLMLALASASRCLPDRDRSYHCDGPLVSPADRLRRPRGDVRPDETSAAKWVFATPSADTTNYPRQVWRAPTSALGRTPATSRGRGCRDTRSATRARSRHVRSATRDRPWRWAVS